MIILQYEGAYLNDGKGLSDWDVLTHETPGDGDDDDNDELYLYTDLNRFLFLSNISFLGYNFFFFEVLVAAPEVLFCRRSEVLVFGGGYSPAGTEAHTSLGHQSKSRHKHNKLTTWQQHNTHVTHTFQFHQTHI
jgi:hypothetical protein